MKNVKKNPGRKPLHPPIKFVIDLRIIITQNLTWESHYKVISGKVYKTLELICRSFSDSSPVVTRKSYVSHLFPPRSRKYGDLT